MSRRFITYAEVCELLDLPREMVERRFRKNGWEGLASLFRGYERQALETIDVDGAYWGADHADWIRTADPYEVFSWLCVIMRDVVSIEKSKRRARA
jgi:hypothetical protein